MADLLRIRYPDAAGLAGTDFVLEVPTRVATEESLGMNDDTGAPHKIVPRYDVDRRLSAAGQANRDAAAPHRPRITQSSTYGTTAQARPPDP